MTPEQRDIILDEIIINNPKIRQDLLQACAGAQLDLNKLKEVLPSAAFVSKVPQGATGPRKAIVHRFWKPHTKYTLSISTCRDILTWLSKFGDLLTSDIDEFVDVVLKETRCPTNFNGALDLIDNHILAVLYTADIIKPSKLTLHRHFDVDQNPIVDNPRISVANALVYKKSRKEQNNNEYDLFEEQHMNIYEQLNKINDAESLSEKYNVKNAKELRKLQESISSIKIPAPWNKYLEVDDYIPEEGEYAIGDKISEYTLVAYLMPKAEYEDMIDEWPMLFKNSEGYIVGTTSHDRVYPYDVEDFGSTESLNESKELTPYQRIQKVLNNMPDSNPKTMDAASRAVDSKELVNNIVKMAEKSGIPITSTNSTITTENKDGSKTTYIVKVKQVPQYVLEEEMIGDIVRTFDEDEFIKKSAVKIVENN